MIRNKYLLSFHLGVSDYLIVLCFTCSTSFCMLFEGFQAIQFVFEVVSRLSMRTISKNVLEFVYKVWTILSLVPANNKLT